VIAEMNQLEIVCLRSDLDALVTLLQEEGLLHVEQVPLAVENSPGYLHRAHLTDERKAEMAWVGQLDRILREIEPLLTAKPPRETVIDTVECLRDRDPRDFRRKVRQWSRGLRSLTRRRVNAQDNIEVLKNHRKILRAIEPIAGAGDALLGKNARAVVLKDGVHEVQAKLRTRFEAELGPGCTLESRRLARRSAVVLIRHAEDQGGAVSAILDEEGIAAVEVGEREVHGMSLAEALAKLDARIAADSQGLNEIADRLAEFSQEIGPELSAVRLDVADRLGRVNVLDDCAVSEMVAVVHGWTPADQVPAFKALLEDKFGGTAVVAELPTEDIERARIPTLLRNRPITRPFEVLLALLQPATYGSYDPTVLVGVFFVGFYGFILGDVGYGLVIILLAHFLRRRLGHIPLVRSVATVAQYCGCSAIFFGILFGEFMGNLGANHFNMPVLWFHRGHETTKLLTIAVGVGAVHVVLSLVLGVCEGIRHHSREHALEKLGLLLALFAVGVGVAVYVEAWPWGSRTAAGAASLLVVVSIGLMVWGMGLTGPARLFEVMSLVSNVLSYCRLMALGLASMILADIANEMGGKVGNIVLGVIVAAMFHTVNIAFGIFSPTLHSLRLNYVEFLPKFYVPEGRGFEPFRKESLW